MTATYDCIATTTVSGTSTNSVTFGSISGNYTDLVLVAHVLQASGADGLNIRVGNGSVDSGTNYSYTVARGVSNFGAGSFGISNSNVAEIGYASEIFSTSITNIFNYANTTMNKMMLSRWGNMFWLDENRTGLTVNLWRSTSAINIITISIAAGSRNFGNGSVLSLYGIKEE